MARWLAGSVGGSIAVHAALSGALVVWVKLHPAPPVPRDVAGATEIELVEPERPAPSAEPTVAPPEPSTAPPPSSPASAAPPPAAPPQRAARVLTTSANGQRPEVAAQPEMSAAPSAAPEPSGPPPVLDLSRPAPSAQPLTAGSLFGTVDRTMAERAGVDLGPTALPRTRQNLFGGPRPEGATPEERARSVIMATVNSELEPSRHMRAAGSGLLARRVGTRAEEEFSPVRTIPNIGSAVARAPVISRPATPHEQSAGEAAAGSELNALRGGQNPTQIGFSGPNMAPCSYRAMRAEVEVDQSPEGEVLATRVTHRSGVARFDEAAERTIRESMSVGDPPRTAPRRTSWTFEISEAVRTPTPFCDNSGWRMLSEESNGVLLRYRVRMTNSRLMPAGGGVSPPGPRNG